MLIGLVLTLHIVAITIFGGIILATAVRILEFTHGTRNLKWASFLIAAASGLTLFAFFPAQYAANPWFWAKIALLALAFALDKPTPVLALLLWLFAAFAGRGPATIKDIMHSMVDPTGDAVFGSIQQISDSHGVHEKAPRTNADWADLRHHLEILENAPALITEPGRRAAHPVDRSRNPGVEEQPESVQRLLDADRPALLRRARRLHDTAALAIAAVDARDKAALLRAIDGIDKACENCHLHYWYPNDKRAQQAAIEDHITDE